MNEELEGRIDDVVADASKTLSDGGDVDPHGLEAQLRLLLPHHTYFEVMPTFIHADGCDQAQQVPVTSVEASWTTPGGLWQIIGVPDPESPDSGLHHLRVKGPDTRLDRSGVTVADIVGLLRTLGAVPAE